MVINAAGNFEKWLTAADDSEFCAETSGRRVDARTVLSICRETGARSHRNDDAPRQLLASGPPLRGKRHGSLIDERNAFVAAQRKNGLKYAAGRAACALYSAETRVVADEEFCSFHRRLKYIRFRDSNLSI